MKAIPGKKKKKGKKCPYLGFVFRAENKNLHEAKTKNEDS